MSSAAVMIGTLNVNFLSLNSYHNDLVIIIPISNNFLSVYQNTNIYRLLKHLEFWLRFMTEKKKTEHLAVKNMFVYFTKH